MKALKTLIVPMHTYENSKVNFDLNKRKETIFEHIANKKHHLHVKDINQIPKILLSKDCFKKDKSNSKNRIYIGRREKQKERAKYIKIVTKINKNKSESIVTVYLIKNCLKN